VTAASEVSDGMFVTKKERLFDSKEASSKEVTVAKPAVECWFGEGKEASDINGLQRFIKGSENKKKNSKK